MAPAPHVVVIAFPFSSHPVMLFRLARALAAAAPAATFAFLSTSASLARLQHAHALPANLRFVEVPDGSPPKGVPRDVAVEHFMAAAEAGGLLEAARASTGKAGARVSCVVADAFVWMAGEAAAAMAAPLVPVWTCGPSALLAHLRADALRGDAATSRPDELLTTYPGLGSYRARDLPDGIVSGDPDHPFLRLFRRIEQHLPAAGTPTPFALNACSGLVPEDVMAALAAQLPSCLSVGPFYLLPGTDSPDTDNAPADPYGCLAWLDAHAARTVAYVSFGTIATAPPEELRELAAGMEATGAPFLWSLPEDLWPQLPPGFTGRSAGLLVPWAPQVQVLRHASVGAFVTHAGWSSVLESVSSGVPMACRPFFTDQRMNARLVHLRGFGATLEEPVTRRGVAALVASLLGPHEGARLRARMQEVRAMAASAFAPGGGSRDNFDTLVNIVCAL